MHAARISSQIPAHPGISEFPGRNGSVVPLRLVSDTDLNEKVDRGREGSDDVVSLECKK